MQRLIESRPGLKLLSKRKLYPIAAAEGISKAEVDEYMDSRELTQVYSKRKKYRTGEGLRITAQPHSYQIDIMHIPQYKYTNSGVTMALLLVEIISRKAFAYPLRSNRMADIIPVYQQFLEEIEMNIVGLQGDDEFSARDFVELNERLGIPLRTDTAAQDHFTGYSNKLGIIDRLTRTLKGLIQKHMLEHRTGRWASALPEILELYNDTPHSSLKGNSPNEVYDDDDFMDGMHKGQRKQNEKVWDAVELGKGDTVRVLLGRATFGKERQNWSTELYTVQEQEGYRFRLVDEDGNEVPRLYKPGELLRVKKPAVTGLIGAHGV